jgi:hypothetical protein
MGTHELGPEAVLGGQLVHAPAPATLEVPAAQRVQADPCPEPKVPAAHVWHAVETPSTKKVPLPQHTATPAAVQRP